MFVCVCETTSIEGDLAEKGEKGTLGCFTFGGDLVFSFKRAHFSSSSITLEFSLAAY